MSLWEPTIGQSDEWFTPKYIFDALNTQFDLDVSAPEGGPKHVPTQRWITAAQCGLATTWGEGSFVWMNPPFGGRNGLVPWLDKFFAHANGIALTPDRTSAPWWQDAALRADCMMLIKGRVKFERPDGSVGKSPSAGVTLWACGETATQALKNARANDLGSLWERI